MIYPAALLFWLLILIGTPALSQSGRDSIKLLVQRQTYVPAVKPKPAVAPTKSPAFSNLKERVHRKDHDLLIHLPQSSNYVQLYIKDALGNTVRLVAYEALSEGFYEIPLLTPQHPGGLYMARLVINQQVYTYQLALLN